MSQNQSNWNKCHLYKVRDHREIKLVDDPNPEKIRSEIEPWLTALFQSEHLSLVLGGGISSAVHALAEN